MSAFHLKLIAIVTMLIDHIGLYFFPEHIAFRIIGRLSFPIFAWAIANGAYYSKNIPKYLTRIFLFALISQIPYFLLNREIVPGFFGGNVLVTLFLGLLSIYGLKSGKKILALITIVISVGTAEVLQSSYGAAGVLSILFFYHFYRKLHLAFLFHVLLYVAFYTAPVFVELYTLGYIPQSHQLSLIQPVGLLTFGLLMKYSHEEGRKLRYLFYVFYPVHFFIIYLVKLRITP